MKKCHFLRISIFKKLTIIIPRLLSLNLKVSMMNGLV